MDETLENNKTELIQEDRKIKKKDLIKQYQDELNKLSSLPDDSSSSDSDIEVITKPPREKKERTQAQKDAFERARKAREEKTNQRKKENEELQQVNKKVIEEKIIKKAISTKKKQIKEISKKIEEESDEEEEYKTVNTRTPIIKEVKKISNPIIEDNKPKFKFI